MAAPYMASAVGMNNMAISLAERCHYSEALKTFKLALQVLQGNMTVSEVEHKLYRAQLYLQTESDGELSFEQERKKQDCSVKIRNIQGRDLLCRTPEITEDEDSTLTCSLIYLQESDAANYRKSTESYSTLLASILQNQAQVCRKLAQDEKDGNISASLHKKSHQLSTLAKAFTEKQSSQLQHGEISSSGVWKSTTKSLSDMPRKNTPPQYPLRRVESELSLRTKHT